MTNPKQKRRTEPVEPRIHDRERERRARDDRLRGGSGTRAREGQHLLEVDERQTFRRSRIGGRKAVPLTLPTRIDDFSVRTQMTRGRRTGMRHPQRRSVCDHPSGVGGSVGSGSGSRRSEVFSSSLETSSSSSISSTFESLCSCIVVG